MVLSNVDRCSPLSLAGWCTNWCTPSPRSGTPTPSDRKPGGCGSPVSSATVRARRRPLVDSGLLTMRVRMAPRTPNAEPSAITAVMTTAGCSETVCSMISGSNSTAFLSGARPAQTLDLPGLDLHQERRPSCAYSNTADRGVQCGFGRLWCFRATNVSPGCASAHPRPWCQRPQRRRGPGSRRPPRRDPPAKPQHLRAPRLNQ